MNVYGLPILKLNRVDNARRESLEVASRRPLFEDPYYPRNSAWSEFRLGVGRHTNTIIVGEFWQQL